MSETRAAAFERFYSDLTARRGEISLRLDALKGEDKTKTMQFRELLTEKLQLTDILIRLETYGIK